MAMEQYLQDAVPRNDSIVEDVASVVKPQSDPIGVDGSEESPSSGFECNICLDFVQDPVVTFCGHLYCWPCIYKWIHFQGVSPETPNQKQPQCPVCKGRVSQNTLVPLYGRGQTAKLSEGKAPNIGIDVPRRPPSPRCGVHMLISPSASANSHPAQSLSPNSYPQRSQPYRPPGMLGAMVYSRMFGNSETNLYTYPNSYHLTGSDSPRIRRRLMKAEESLGRLCCFLCCSMVFCLLLF